MIYLVLYDNRGQCQRVARVSSRVVASEFISAGFTEVSKDEYDQCALLVPEATIADLPALEVASSLVNRIQQASEPNPNIPSANQNALDRLISSQSAKLREITQRYVDKQLTQSQWYRLMVDAINAGNVASTALAVGGVDNITSDGVARIERANQIQIEYLTRFRRDSERLSDKAVVARAILYAGALTARYWTAHTRANGLVLPAMPAVRTSCHSNCKCNWDIRQLDGNGNWDCYWRISAIESCDECLQRQRVFNPLRVRNYIVEPFNPSGIYR